MRLCTACQGQRSPLVLPHEETCRGSVAPINIGSPLCECKCTPASTKRDLEAQYRHRSWIALTSPIDTVDVEQPEFPLDHELHVIFTHDEHNTNVERLTRNGAELLVRRLNNALGADGLPDMDTLAQYVLHAMSQAKAGRSLAEACSELPMVLERLVRRKIREAAQADKDKLEVPRG